MRGSIFQVLIIDNSVQARKGIRAILNSEPSFHIVAEGGNGMEAIVLTERWKPDLILMDIQMPGMDGLEATKRIKEKYPFVKIVIMSVSDDITHFFDAFKKGAQGYLMKNLKPESWLEYLKAVVVDEAQLTKELTFHIMKEFSQREGPDSSTNPLTQRETEILSLVTKGLVNRDISDILGISVHTVKNHLKNIMHKLQLINRVQLTRYAFEKGWLGR
ncbi:response regulator [Paenibacillus sp. 1P07SE]|uniref:response regulator n=1 Tax=Paenibacillus sp. 1P07SE TaxID=3132209 RepID=UPI0039A59E4A